MTTRLNITTTPETRARIEALQQNMRAASLGETIGRALTLGEWVVEQQLAGRNILVQEGDEAPTIVKFVF